MRSCMLFVCLFCLFLGRFGLASDGFSEADAFFGKGTHALFASQYDEAISHFSQVKADPRSIFFRGVAHFRLGNLENAKNDFALAAAIEQNAKISVNSILNRIQGPERLLIEEARQIAKRDWQVSEARRQQQRYGEMLNQKKSVAKELASAAVKSPDPAAPDAELLPFGAMPADPFKNVAKLTYPIDWSPTRPALKSVKNIILSAAEEIRKESQQPQKPAPKVAKPSDNPFEDDPFGASDSPNKPAAVGADPFGAPANNSDPFF